MQSQSPYWATKSNMPAPGAFNVPNVPPGYGQVTMPPVPPAARPGNPGVFAPKGPALPGASSTGTILVPGPAPAPPPPISDLAPPAAVPTNQGPAFPPVPGTLQTVPEGPSLSNVPPLPTTASPTEN